MSDGSVTAITGASPGSLPAPAAASPTGQQVARFEQQLNAPAAEPAQYGVPNPETTGFGDGLRSAIGDVGRMDNQFRTHFEEMYSDADTTTEPTLLDPREAAAMHVLRDTSDRAIRSAYDNMLISWVSSAEHSFGQSLRTLLEQT